MNPEERKTTPKRSGFTLVELVVVIAILGILAGIGYVGYSGYIRYARRAADDEYIGAVNEALATACQEAGVDHSKLGMNAADVSFRDSSNKESTTTKLLSLSLPSSTSQERDAKKKASAKNYFDHYFEGSKGNKDMVLKFYDADSIVFMGNGQLFVAYEDPESASQAIWGQSSFKDAEERQRLGNAAKSIHDFINASTQLPRESSIHDALETLNTGDYGFHFESSEIQEIESYFSDVLKWDKDKSLSREQLGNGITAYIAHKTAELSGDPQSRSDLLENLRSTENYRDYTEQLVEAPMQLAALEAYYHSDEASDGFKKRFDQLMNGFDTEEAGLQGLLSLEAKGFSIFLGYQDKVTGEWIRPDENEQQKFQAYKNSAQFETDMAAYFDIMNEANRQSGSLDANDSSFLDSVFSFLNG